MYNQVSSHSKRSWLRHVCELHQLWKEARDLLILLLHQQPLKPQLLLPVLASKIQSSFLQTSFPVVEKIKREHTSNTGLRSIPSSAKVTESNTGIISAYQQSVLSPFENSWTAFLLTNQQPSESTSRLDLSSVIQRLGPPSIIIHLPTTWCLNNQSWFPIKTNT